MGQSGISRLGRLFNVQIISLLNQCNSITLHLCKQEEKVMSRRLNRISQSDQDGVDMTPMLDIVFILLIFFIVTAVFLDEKGVDFTQASGDVPAGPTTAVISIVVDSEDDHLRRRPCCSARLRRS